MGRLSLIEECEEEHCETYDILANPASVHSEHCFQKELADYTFLPESSGARHIYDEINRELKDIHDDLVGSLYEASEAGNSSWNCVNLAGSVPGGMKSNQSNSYRESRSSTESMARDNMPARGSLASGMETGLRYLAMEDEDGQKEAATVTPKMTGLRGGEGGTSANTEEDTIDEISVHKVRPASPPSGPSAPSRGNHDAGATMRGGRGPGYTSRLSHLWSKEPKDCPQPEQHPRAAWGGFWYDHDNRNSNGSTLPEHSISNTNDAAGNNPTNTQFPLRGKGTDHIGGSEGHARATGEAIPPPIPAKSLRRQQKEYKPFGPSSSRTENGLLMPSQVADPDVITPHSQSTFWDIHSEVPTEFLAVTQIAGNTPHRGRRRAGMDTIDEEAIAEGIKQDFLRKLVKINEEKVREENEIWTHAYMTQEEKEAALRRLTARTRQRFNEASEVTGYSSIDDKVAVKKLLEQMDPGTASLYADSTWVLAQPALGRPRQQPAQQPIAKHQNPVAVVGRAVHRFMRAVLNVPDDPRLKSYSRRFPPETMTQPLLANSTRRPPLHNVSPHSVSAQLGNLGTRSPRQRSKSKRKLNEPGRPNTAPGGTTGRSAEQAYAERERRMRREVQQELSGSTLKDSTEQSDYGSAGVAGVGRGSAAHGRRMRESASTAVTQWPTQSEVHGGGVTAHARYEMLR